MSTLHRSTTGPHPHYLEGNQHFAPAEPPSKPPAEMCSLTPQQQRDLARRNVESIKRQRAAGLLDGTLVHTPAGKAKIVRPAKLTRMN